MANIKVSKVFSVNIVAEADTGLIEKFVEPQERAGNKLGGVDFRTGRYGMPDPGRARCTGWSARWHRR